MSSQPELVNPSPARRSLPLIHVDTQIRVLGQGTFGVVVKALDLRQQPPVVVAIKLLRRGEFIRVFQTYVKREIVHQSSLKHPFIIGLTEVHCVNEKNSHVMHTSLRSIVLLQSN